MPRRAPPSAPAPAASGKKRARERGADDDGADDDNDDHPQQGPPTTTSIAEKSKKALRMEHLSLMVELRNEGLEYLRRQGLERKKTEAKGDCWLLALLADQLPATLLSGLTKEQRKEHLSVWRKRLFDFAPNVDTQLEHVDTKLGKVYLNEVAMLFDVKEEVRADATKTKAAIMEKLEPWKAIKP